jgi:hypothetical protein
VRGSMEGRVAWITLSDYAKRETPTTVGQSLEAIRGGAPAGSVFMVDQGYGDGRYEGYYEYRVLLISKESLRREVWKECADMITTAMELCEPGRRTTSVGVASLGKEMMVIDCLGKVFSLEDFEGFLRMRDVFC